MKKILATIILFATLTLPAAALASSVTLAPATVAIAEGKTFSVMVGVDPTSGKAYTVRANLSFDPAAVVLTGFTFAPKWLALPQEGYDTEDNVSGAMAKTGGYPGGVTAATTLGTATFRAKKSGVTTIASAADSLILDAGNQNTATGKDSVQITISATAKTALTPAAPRPTLTPVVTNVATETAENAETATATPMTIESVPQAAAVALSPLDNILTLGTGSAAVASLAAIVALLIAAGIFWLWRRRL